MDFDLWGVLTEFGQTLGWRYIFWNVMNGYIAPIEKNKLGYRFPPDIRYIVMEPFVHPDFYKLAESKSDINKVLFVAGYWGQIFFNKAVKIILQIMKKIPQMQIIAVCGKNEILLRRLMLYFKSYPDSRIKIYGETDSLLGIMKECSSIITKPGFSTIAEAHVAGRKIFLIKGMPVAEDNNARHAIEYFDASAFEIKDFLKWYNLNRQ